MTGTISPANEKLAFEVGKTYLDVSGHKVRIICVDKLGECPIVGLLLHALPGKEIVIVYYPDGSAFAAPSLISEYKEPVYTWYSVYKNGWISGTGYDSKAKCIETATSDFINFMKVDQKTGEVSNG